MPIRIEPYCARQEHEWDAFIQHSSRNGGIFQERNFLGYHAPGKFHDDSLTFWSGNAIAGVLPVARVDTPDGRIVAHSHPGSTAGGLIYHREMTLREVLSLLELAIDYYRSRGYDRLELRLAESLFSYPTDGELLYLLWHRGFQLVTREIGSCVNLEQSDNWLSLGRRKNPGTIRSLKKQGIICLQTDDPNASFTLVINNLEQRYGKRSTHTLEELADLKARYPDRLHFWLAARDDTPIATIVVFVVNRHAVHDFYIAQDYAYAKLNVMPALFYQAFEYYQAKGFHWFNFGLSSRADLIKWGILEFKERMGGRATYKDVWALGPLSEYRPYQPPRYEQIAI
jgi:hypothetical protein